MDFSSSFDALVPRLPGLTLLATPTNSASPPRLRLPSPPRSPDPSPRPSPGPIRRGRRGARASPLYTRRRSPSRASPYRVSRPPSPRRASSRRPPPRSTGNRRPSFPDFPRMSPPIRPLFPSRLVVVTIIDNVVADVASFSS